MTYVSSPTPTPVENRTTFRGVNPEDAESSSLAETTAATPGGDVLLRLNGNSFDILDCNFAENSDAVALRFDRGVEGALEG